MNKNNIYYVNREHFQSRYNVNGSSLVTVSAARRGDPLNESRHTAFDDAGGLRLLTEEEVLDLVASENAAEGWKHGDVEPDGALILTY
jgi:hypothetical protein